MNENNTPYDITRFCSSFPYCSNPIVSRDNLVNTIERLFQDNNIVFLEGESNVGKTILGSEFANRHSERTICLFLKSGNNWCTDIAFIRNNLYDQILYFMNKIIPNDDIIVDQEKYGTIIYNISRHCNRTNSTVYFIIDGLDFVNDENTRKSIMELFPLGCCDKFKFLIIIRNKSIILSDKLISKQITFDNLIVSDFTEGEASKLFEDIIEIEDQQIKRIYKSFKKPGNLASIYRILKNTKNPLEITENQIYSLEHLFLSEWESNNISTEDEIILATIAFDMGFVNISYLSKVCEKDEMYINNFIKRITFIELYDNTISFISEEFRNYIRSKLNTFASTIYENGLKVLLQNPDNSDSVQIAPYYYKQLGQFGKILEYITAERILDDFKRTNSESKTISIIKAGSEAAIFTQNEQSSFRYALLESISDIFTYSTISEQEIQAIIMMEDYSGALVIANQAKTKEDKLLLLSQIIMWQKRKGITPDESATRIIKQLCETIDYKTIKNKAIKISSYLLYTMPDLAVSIIESIGQSEKGEKSTDIAIARITMTGIIAAQNNQNYGLDIEQDSITNSTVKSIYSELNVLLKDQQIDKVMLEIETMSSKSSKLLFLRNWLILHRYEDLEGEITQKAIELSIDAHEYNLTSSILCDISSAIPYINNKKNIELIEWFGRQSDELKVKNPSTDFVALKINIIKAQIKTDTKKAIKKIEDIILWSEELQDVSIQTECLALIEREVIKLNREYQFEEKEELIAECKKQIQINIGILINRTADHYEVLLGIIEILSQIDVDYTLEIIKKVNTAERRDDLREKAIGSIFNQKDEEIQLKEIIKIIENMENENKRSKEYSKIVRKIRKEKNLRDREYINFLISDKIEGRIEDNGDLCIFLASSIIVAMNYGLNIDSEKKSIEMMEKWEGIVSPDERIQVGLDIVYILAETHKVLAQNIYGKVQNYKSTVLPLTNNEINACALLVSLYIRGLYGLARNSALCSLDMENLDSLIDFIPSEMGKCFLWSEFVLILIKAHDIKQAKIIYNDKVIPIYNKYKDNKEKSYKILVRTAPSFFLTNEAFFLDEITSCPILVQDESLYNICTYILTKTIQSDPYENSESANLKITYQEIPMLFTLIKKIKDEGMIYTIIEQLTDFINNNKKIFDKTQRIDITIRIDSMIRDNLKGEYPIKHNGYKICTIMQKEKIDDGNKGKDNKKIEDMISDIDNIADQAFIWCELASASKKADDKRSYLMKANELAEMIPSDYDKIWHMEMIAKTAWLCNEKQLSRVYFKEIVENIKNFNSIDKGQTASQRLIEVAHHLDPDLARTLASLVESENTHQQIKESMKKQQRKLDELDKIIDQSESDDKIIEDKEYIDIIWDALGKLNAGRINPTKVKLLQKSYKRAAKNGISRSYPLYLWVIENINNNYIDGNNCALIIRPMVNSLYSACKFYSSYLSYLHNQIYENRGAVRTSLNGLVFDQQQYLEKLEEWFKSTMSSEVYIIDRYFGLEEMNIVKIIKEINNEVNINIITCANEQKKKKINLEEIEETYSEYWRNHFSLSPLKKTVIALLSTEPSGGFPIHDRWIISGNSAIHLGTSLNSIGRRLSGSNIEEKGTVEDIKAEIKMYLSGERKNINEEKVRCRIYNI